MTYMPFEEKWLPRILLITIIAIIIFAIFGVGVADYYGDWPAWE